MGIDDRFQVVIEYATSSKSGNKMSISAREFFEADDYDESEWGCDLPWRLAMLTDYLPTDETDLVEATLTITDVELKQERTVYVRRLNGIQLTISWDDRRTAPGRFEVILEVSRDCSRDIVEVARLDVNEIDVNLMAHYLIEGDKLKSFITDR
jgi:hypothetical protein